MPLTLEEPVAYAVFAHKRRATTARSLSLYGRELYATPVDARRAEAEARSTGECDEVLVREFHVASSGVERAAPVLAEIDSHLGKPVLYLVEGHGGLSSGNHWHETCGDALFASLDVAEALQAEARASGRYEEVVVLACPVAEPSISN